MATFGDIWNELTATVRVLDPLAAQKFTNRAWQTIGKAYEWSWLRALGVLTAPAAISTGTVSINQFTRDLTFNAAATTVLDAVTFDIPLSTRQIKIGGGPPYSIANYTAGGTATLDPLGPAFQETSAVASTYTIVKAYYAPPSTDFARFISVRDPISGYPMAFGPKFTEELLDRIDPTRSDGSLPMCIATLYSQRTIASGGETTAYSPRWEIWPHPTTARGFQVVYRKRTTDFVNDDDTIPDSINPELVLTLARAKSYEWAETNKADQPLLKATNWTNLMVTAMAEYKMLLSAEIKGDKEIFPASRVTQQWPYGGWPYSPQWAQSHDSPLDLFEAMRGGYYY